MAVANSIIRCGRSATIYPLFAPIQQSISIQQRFDEPVDIVAVCGAVVVQIGQ